MAKNLQARLKAAQEDWENADARQGGGLPDGEYEGVIESVVIGLSKGEKPRMQCTWKLKVTGENSNGRSCMKFSGMESADNLAWFKGDLKAIEIEIPDDFSTIGESVAEAVGVGIRFKVRSRDEFTNVDFIERLEGGEVPDEVEESTKPEVLTAADIRAMSEDQMEALIAKASLGIVTANYETWEEVADLIVAAFEE